MKGARIEHNAEHVRLLKALAHPTRLEILNLLGYRDASPKDFALAHGMEIPQVSPHFRKLAELGFIELVRTRPVRGSTEHIYRRVRRPVFSDSDWLLLPEEVRQIIASTTMGGLVDQMTLALQAGTLTARPNTHLSWWRMRLDEQGWKEVTAYLKATFDAIEKARKRSAERMRVSGELGFEATAALAGFESPSEEPVGVMS
ncbi:MAG TPA: helix-turn-helix domain-containing protein [Solirubrobacterales bacterium]|nr:helix-turn-helix domain-containing protein [Solirubrobacterales bacterium]